MASAREYSHLTDGVRRDFVAMIEKAVVQKRKGEGLIVHGSQCHGFIDEQLTTVRETSYLDGAPHRAMTLVSSPAHPTKLELSLDDSMVGVEVEAASKAAKKWGGKAAVGSGETRSRLRSNDRGSWGSTTSSVETLVLETERVLRARRDATVVVNVREREPDRGSSRGRPVARQAPSWSAVSLTAEEIFRQCNNGKCWVGDKGDSNYIYCTLKQSCNVDKDFVQYLSTIQLHLYGVSKLQRFL